MTFDLVIDDALIVDGTGAAPRPGSVAVRGDRIVEVGDVDGSAHRRIDAGGAVLTPGFVDIHTHLDAQIWWDPVASSSCWHGVTSIVMGNCGVSFAPCRPGDREYLAALMESVEDIPAPAMLEGMPWNWETYGDFLASLDATDKGVNVGGMVGHCALRYHVMGERALEKEPASVEEIASMKELLAEAIDHGALGFSTSRTLSHRVPDGRPIPGTYALPDELLALADVMARRGSGVFEAVARLGEGDDADLSITRAEIDWMARVASWKVPVTFALIQNRVQPDLYRRVLSMVADAEEAGGLLRPQTTSRSVGILLGLQAASPWGRTPEWLALMELAPALRTAAINDPATRAALLEAARSAKPIFPIDEMYYLGDTDARYVYDAGDSLAAIARGAGEHPAETFLRLSETTDGAALFNYPIFNYDVEAIVEMLADPNIVLGLGDSGAHVGGIMDASWPTYFLSRWCRDLGVFDIADAVRRMTSEPADLFGIRDRGRIQPGGFADLNVLDLDALRLPLPEVACDLPGGAPRFVQRADGYLATVVNGEVFMTDGEHSGALAGVTLRGRAGA